MNEVEKAQNALLKELLDKSDAAYNAEVSRQAAEMKMIQRQESEASTQADEEEQ